MPGLDGTGPMGMGPMTGGGRGFCNPAWAGYWGAVNPWFGYRGYSPWPGYGFAPYGWRFGGGFPYRGIYPPWPRWGYGGRPWFYGGFPY
ncbi:MAG: DUF5320 family protein [Deltaproteobacteria bacterium]|nr:DUF5320 family protein [Deltaproteobacteria bacterium]MBW2123118.1 DUF5320 family protein [Deltaproteobacteria bacterium]